MLNFKIKVILLVILLNFLSLSANVVDYQEIYQQEQKEFNQEMTEEIKNQLSSASWKVKRIYKEINYQPVWVDKDYLTHHTELLVAELKEDFEKGLHKELVADYKKLMTDDNKIFQSESLEDKANVEIGIMQLYVDVIDDILKDKKSKHTALTLLKKALTEQSLIASINTISNERILSGTALDMNASEMKEKQEAYQKTAARLMGDDKEDRIKAMYELLEYQPIWITEEGLTSYTKELFSQIENDITLETNSTTYSEFQNIKNSEIPTKKEDIVVKEFEIAKLYQDYMSHVLYGDIDWKKFQSNLRKTHRNGVWVVHNILASPESLLIGSMKQKTLKHAFKGAKPLFPLYDRLLTALKQYQQIVSNGGWDILPEFKNLKPGMKDPVVPVLRERLTKEGDYASCNEHNVTERYDDCLVEAVKKFQARHGLEAEGFVGKMTRKALSESAESKVARIKLNIDRVKWLKRGHDRYHIFVNIPSYTMYMFDELDIIKSMRVITGRKGHETPIFYGRVRTIVLNPYWRIPASIIRHETIPKLQKDPGYTNKKKIEIHTGYSEHSPRVDPHGVNWHKYGKKLPPYKFMQSPGEHNALGKVKYLFPNKYAVYMHDTNQRNLFVKDYRALSHGCVRLHKPFELLETFAQIEPKIDSEKSKMILDKNKKTPYRLSNSVPVDLIYLTTLVDRNGTVMFSDDVYGYDKMQLDVSKD